MSQIPNKKSFEKEVKNKLISRCAGQMTEETLLLKAFKYYDLNNSGQCTPEQFMKSLIRVGINSVNEDNLSEIFSLYDIEGSGYISYRDFINSVFNQTPYTAKPPQIKKKVVNKNTKSKQQLINENKELLSKIRDVFLNRGIDCLMDFSKSFKIIDDDNSNFICKDEFMKVCNDYGFGLKPNEIETVYNVFDIDNSNQINYDEFLRTIRGTMNPFRKAIVEQAFNKLDTNKNGEISMEEIMDKYAVRRHPDILKGLKSEQEVYEEFANTFQKFHNILHGETQDNIVTRNEFISYYDNISMYIDNDEYFETLMKNAWRLGNEMPRKGGWTNTKAGNSDNKKQQSNVPLSEPSPEKDALLDKLRKALFMKGSRSIVGMIRLFKRIDVNNISGVDVEEFTQVLNESLKNDKSIDVGNAMNINEIRKLFNYFDTNKTSIINYQNFITELCKGEMNDIRKDVLIQAFDHLDTESKGEIAVKELKNRFDIPTPNPIPDLLESFEIYHNIIRGTRNPYVSLEDFIGFYNLISFLIPSDQTFCAYVSYTWRLNDYSIRKYKQHKTELGNQKLRTVKPKEGDAPSSHRKTPYGIDDSKGTVNKKKYLYEERDLSINELIEIFRDSLKGRGVRGIMGIRRAFMLLDVDDSKNITYDEFENLLRKFRIKLKENDVLKLFQAFDKDNSQAINYDEFVYAIVGMMNDFRLSVVQRVFEKLDEDKKGYVTLEEMRMGFNPKESPLVRKGKKNEEEVLADFIDLLEYHFNLLNEKQMEIDEDGQMVIEYEDIVNFFNNISMNIDEDKYFEVKLVSEWGLDIDGKYPYQKGWTGEEVINPYSSEFYKPEHASNKK